MKTKKILAAALCTMLLSGCGVQRVIENNRSENSSSTADRNSGTSTSDAPETSAASEEAEVAGYNVGDTAQLGDWEITVNSVEAVDSIQNTYGAFKQDEGNKYIAVNVTAKNLGTEKSTFLPTYGFSGTIGAKIVYGEYEFSGTNLLGYDDDLHDTSLNPLSSKTGIMAFSVAEEVAENLSELHLVFSEKGSDCDFSLQ